MRYSALVLALSVLAAAAPAPPAQSRHETHSLDVDGAIISRLEELFQEPSSAAGLVARAPGDTRNDLNNGQCDDVIVIWARGTFGSGNLGTGVGPAFVAAVASAEPSRVIVQGVLPYPATIAGYLAGGSEEGANSMAALTQKAATQCPSARIILSGYSQGAQVTHKAATRIPSGLRPRIAGIVLFGDPNNGVAFPGTLNSNVRTFCNSDDPICRGVSSPTGGHLTYERNAAEAAAWVAARV